jgi:hypothetical protein
MGYEIKEIIWADFLKSINIPVFAVAKRVFLSIKIEILARSAKNGRSRGLGNQVF